MTEQGKSLRLKAQLRKIRLAYSEILKEHGKKSKHLTETERDIIIGHRATIRKMEGQH